MRKLAFYTLAVGLIIAGPTWGQQQGGGSPGGGSSSGSPGGGASNPGGGRPSGGQQSGRDQQQNDPFGQQRQRMPEMRRPIFLSGKVVLDNGEVPPEPVTIVKICSGQQRPETYTDTKGRFSFEVGGDSTIALTDASYSGVGGLPGQPGRPGGFGNVVGTDAFGSVDLSGCELRADLPGFLSDPITLGRRRPLDNPDVGVIVLRKIGGYDGSAISVTTLQAPKKARAAYEKALRELRKSKPKLAKAAQSFEKAVAEYPQFASAWNYLGETRSRSNDFEGAAAAYEKAMEADPDYIKPYVSLTRIRLQEEDWEEVNELSEAVLSRNPAASQYRYFQAAALFNLGRLEESEEAARALQERGEADQFPQTHRMLGVIHAKRGAFKTAAEEFRSYLALEPNDASGDVIRRQLDEWEQLGVIQKAQAAAAQE